MMVQRINIGLANRTPSSDKTWLMACEDTYAVHDVSLDMIAWLASYTQVTVHHNGLRLLETDMGSADKKSP